jgi:cyclopropane fatty-acyl-phospholipid synthase-like methyltransferase
VGVNVINMKTKRFGGWIVKNDRPEEYLQNPIDYYTDDEVERYSRSGGMRRAQEKIAYRVLELLKLKRGCSLLDLGSGPGYTAEVYRSEGCEVTCLDLVPKMVEKAKERGFESYLGDMRDIKRAFSKRKFDGVVSVSALQWIKDKKGIEMVAEGVHSVLKKGGMVVIQFYPKSEEELEEIASIFCKKGFSGEIVTDWPEVPKNRVVYLVLKKSSFS